MAIAPRCFLTFGATGTGVGTFSPGLTGWTNSGAGPTGTAPAVGDLVLLISAANGTTNTASQTAGTGTWTFQSTGDYNGGVAMCTFVAWRIFDGTETTPTFAWSGSLTRNTYSLLAFAPDTGNAIGFDVWAPIKTYTTGSTSHQANAATAAGTGELSAILSGLIAAANGTTAISVTAPSGWTDGATGSNPGTSSSKSFGSNIYYKENVGSGSVAPGPATTNVSTEANIYHVLIKEAASTVVPYRPQVVSQAVNRAATY